MDKDRIAAFAKLAESNSANKMILPYDVTKMLGGMDTMGVAFFGRMSGKANAPTTTE